MLPSLRDPSEPKTLEEGLRRLSEVLREMAERASAGHSEREQPVPEVTVTVPNSREPPWERQHIVNVLALMKRSPRPLGGAWSYLNLCADDPEQWISFAEIHKHNHSSRRPVQTQADLGAFTKYVTQIRGSRGWPTESQFIGGARHYRCDTVMSKWIRDNLVSCEKKCTRVTGSLQPGITQQGLPELRSFDGHDRS
jgi:hypothetical protein